MSFELGETQGPENGMIFQLYSLNTQRYAEVPDGNTANGIQLVTSPERIDADCYRQLWLFKQTADRTAWTIQNIQSGTFIDLAGGGAGNDVRIQGWVGVANEKNQQWVIQPIRKQIAVIETGGPVYQTVGWSIQNQKTLSAVDAGGGNNNLIHSWKFNPDNPNHRWRLVPKSMRANDLLRMFNRASGIISQFRTYSRAGDDVYVVVPQAIINRAWQQTGLRDVPWRDQLFDCDDFAFAMKGALARSVQVSFPGIVKGFGLLFGIAFGQNADKNAHAFNVTVSWDMKKLWAFEPQNGRWDMDNGNLGYNYFFGIF